MMTRENKQWMYFLISLAASLAISFALLSHHASDPSLTEFSKSWGQPQNWLGYMGSFSADLLFQVFGYSSWITSLFLLSNALYWLKRDDKEHSFCWMSWASLTILMIASCLFLELSNPGRSDSFWAQGLIGLYLGKGLLPILGRLGSALVCLLLFWSAFSLIKENFTSLVFRTIWNSCVWTYCKIRENMGKKSAESSWSTRISISNRSPSQELLTEPEIEEEPRKLFPKIRAIASRSRTSTKRKTLAKKSNNPQNWQIPELTLLNKPTKIIRGPSKDELIFTAKKIVETLESFDIKGEIKEITPGPIITMYEFQPAVGVRIHKIKNTSVDLAMTLGAPSVRIVAPIPGKSVAGIEVPNDEKQDVLLRDVIENTAEKAASMKIPLPLGKDAEGLDVIEDLAKMPHLLVGGATSMGKSVFINSLLTSLLCRFSPEELRLIIVDPKLVEFKSFEEIPHLLLPIVNDPEDANQSLKWAVNETKRRYKLLQKIGAKNLEGFNEKLAIADSSTIERLEENEQQNLPYIVIIIDELAELMLTAKKSVEQSIVRLTQLARAAGIHLIMATQRPSADVVTGLIKSNCPSRASLRVASAIDSRIILDCPGAEQLIGKGDLFFTSAGPMSLKRMQGPFVSDEEIENICTFWSEQGSAEFNEEILDPHVGMNGEMIPDDVDDLYSDVLNFAKEKGKISTSLIQRRFQIGYTRAARIMEQLEVNGIVSEQASAGKARDVLV